MQDLHERKLHAFCYAIAVDLRHEELELVLPVKCDPLRCDAPEVGAAVGLVLLFPPQIASHHCGIAMRASLTIWDEDETWRILVKADVGKRREEVMRR